MFAGIFSKLVPQLANGLTSSVYRLKSFKALLGILPKICRQLILTLVALISIPLGAGRALALSLGGIGQNVATNLTGIAKAVQMFGFVAGLTLVVMGLMELYNSGRQHDASLKGGITKCAVGAALLAVDALISSFSTTIFGGNESGVGLGGLGL
jgi:hypothetical protein